VRGRWLGFLLGVATVAAVPTTASAEPFVSRSCNGSQLCDVWFTGPVSLDWTYTGSPTAGCVDETLMQDTQGSVRACHVVDAGESASKSVTIKLDQTPPIITAAVADRPPDHAGWYTHPVRFTAQSSDVTSGLAGCEAPSYSGPDSANATFVATCRDIAGNSATRSFALSYDATPPDPAPATVSTGDKVVRLHWPAGSTATLTRTPGLGGAANDVVYEGPGTGFTDRRVGNGKRYRYLLTLTDAAGNSASRELSGVPGRHLIAPAKKATLVGPPLLTWTPVRGARYYNVQIFRKGRKILSVWPKQARLQLKSEWRFRGKRRRLKPGVYRWYVWPGEGRPAKRDYGKLIGSRKFAIMPPA
jgi:hypothetical protein